jgi:uncharacterized protein YmfQ (DUF2313 family)
VALAEDYRDQLLRLLPPGRAWATEIGTNLSQLLYAWADELARVHGRGLSLLDVEAYADTTEELIVEWENDAGLPDECSGAAGTLEARRDVLVRKLTDFGLQRLEDYEAAALAIGYTITVDEFTPLRCGDPCGLPINGWEWWFVLQVNAPETTIFEAKAGEAVAGDPLRWWGNELLECTIQGMQQAHVFLIFSYT